jgi:hypothetical protein
LICICSVKLSKDQDHGKVYGRLVWRGKPRDKDERIGPVRKPDWKIVEIPNYHTFKGTPEDVQGLIAASEAKFKESGVWVNPALAAAYNSNSEVQTAK